MDELGVQRLHNEEDIAVIGFLRVEAWSGSGGLPYFAPKTDVWVDAHDEHATHWGIFSGLRLVAAARCCIHDLVADIPDCEAYRGYEDKIAAGKIASLNRLVILPDFRGQGLAKKLDYVRVEWAQSNGCSAIVGWSSVPSRWRALEKMGFTMLGRSKVDTRFEADSLVFSRSAE